MLAVHRDVGEELASHGDPHDQEGPQPALAQATRTRNAPTHRATAPPRIVAAIPTTSSLGASRAGAIRDGSAQGPSSFSSVFATSLSAPHFRAQLENGRNPLAESPNHCPRATCAQIGLSSLATSWSGRGAYQPSRVGPDRPAPARRVALYSANQPHPLFEDLSWRFAMSLGRLGLTFGSCFRLPFTVFAQGHNLERGGVLGCDRSLNTVDE